MLWFTAAAAWLLAGTSPGVAAAATVGAYYYPWYGPDAGGHHYDHTLRYHLTPETQPPALGAYNSRDPRVISAHIDHSHRANVSMWSLSWWGPGGFEDLTIRHSILAHPRASELKYTIHYESAGRLGSFAAPNYSRLISDFQYLGEHVLNDPNYLRIDGRPVVVIYLSREYFKSQAGWDALADVRSMMQTNFGYDPYIVGDHLFNSLAPGAQYLDAVTGFDVYGQVFSNRPTSIAQINRLATIYSAAQNQADFLGVDFIPGVAPGYNDKAVRAGNAPSPRYVEGPGYGPDAQGSTLREILRRAALPHTDDDLDGLILVNSFNEWHEDTQIEPTIVTSRTNTDDTATGVEYTAGQYYEGYGSLYLDILRQETRAEVLGDFNLDGRVDSHDLTGVDGWQSRYGLDLGGTDLLQWQRNYGFSLWGASAAIAAPEPLGMGLAAFAMSTMAIWAIKKRPMA